MERLTTIKESIINFIVDYYKKTQFYPSYDEIAKGRRYYQEI